jgi:hypothetical protein
MSKLDEIKSTKLYHWPRKNDSKSESKIKDPENIRKSSSFF